MIGLGAGALCSAFAFLFYFVPILCFASLPLCSASLRLLSCFTPWLLRLFSFALLLSSGPLLCSFSPFAPCVCCFAPLSFAFDLCCAPLLCFFPLLCSAPCSLHLLLCLFLSAPCSLGLLRSWPAPFRFASFCLLFWLPLCLFALLCSFCFLLFSLPYLCAACFAAVVALRACTAESLE